MDYSLFKFLINIEFDENDFPEQFLLTWEKSLEISLIVERLIPVSFR